MTFLLYINVQNIHLYLYLTVLSYHYNCIDIHFAFASLLMYKQGQCSRFELAINCSELAFRACQPETDFSGSITYQNERSHIKNWLEMD